MWVWNIYRDGGPDERNILQFSSSNNLSINCDAMIQRCGLKSALFRKKIQYQKVHLQY